MNIVYSMTIMNIMIKENKMSSISKSQIDTVLGKILKQYRIKNHLTQEQLSEKLDISLKYISRIENGNGGIKTQTLINYMNILGIEPNLLYGDLINNKSIQKHIELSEKLQYLSPEKVDFIMKMIHEMKGV